MLLRNRDEKMAVEAARIEEEIDSEEVAIEEDCLKLIALYQPVAGDLRFIMSVLKMNGELERMGDLASHISDRAKALAQEPEVVLPADLSAMASEVQSMVRRSHRRQIRHARAAVCRCCTISVRPRAQS